MSGAGTSAIGPKPSIEEPEATSVVKGEADQVFAVRHFRV
jgi:hypothetical protein